MTVGEFLDIIDEDKTRFYHYLHYLKNIITVVNTEGDGKTTEIVLPIDFEINGPDIKRYVRV